jgi:DNA-binding FadR family transcriptional regulator
MKNRNLVETTINQLKRYIEKEELETGTKLPIEKELAEQFGVGRSTLREAVKILEYGNILEVRQGAGTFIKEGKKSNYSDQELIEAREMIETTSARLACEKRTEEDLEIINQALFKRNRLLEKGQFSEYIQADLAFHFLIVKSSKNQFLIRWYEEIYDALKQLLSGLVIDSTEYKDNTAQHNLMFQGIVDREEEIVVSAILENSKRK